VLWRGDTFTWAEIYWRSGILKGKINMPHGRDSTRQKSKRRIYEVGPEGLGESSYQLTIMTRAR